MHNYQTKITCSELCYLYFFVQYCTKIKHKQSEINQIAYKYIFQIIQK